MLFTSYEFIVFFFPVVVILFYLLARASVRVAAIWLFIASLAFYGSAFPGFLPILLASIAMNYLVGWGLIRFRGKGASLLLAFGVTANLAVLGYFKYSRFIAETLHPEWVVRWHLDTVALPLGISFFTFTQIAFLVDAYRGQVKELHPVRYALFVSYFPHLVAGPILHHREMTDQFKDPGRYRLKALQVAGGATIFIAGLFKKICLADPLAAYADPVFQSLKAPEFLAAWGAALSYTFQLYFDFSGYSDMAIGLSLILGFKLPINFDSPYRAVNIGDFWRRWHMTLSRFLRDYLYIPLGGGRCGPWRRIMNVGVTMLLGGLWHGANWTFVAWGALHAFYLMVHHAWSGLRNRCGWNERRPAVFTAALSVGLTFLAVLVGWVLFRANNLDSAWGVLRGMAGLNGMETAKGPGAAGWARLALSAFFIWFMPNVGQWMRNADPTLGVSSPRGRWQAAFTWRPTWGWLLAVVILFWVALASSTSIPRAFLYYQF